MFNRTSEISYHITNCTLTILENILTADIDYIRKAGTEYNVIQILVQLLKHPNTRSETKLFASEIISLLALDIDNREVFAKTTCFQQIFQLLMDHNSLITSDSETQEYYLNLFTVISSCVLENSNREFFLDNEGMEVMLSYLKYFAFVIDRSKKYYSEAAYTTIVNSIVNSERACRYLIDNKGLKFVFPILAGKALKNKGMKENSITIIFNLLIHLDASYRERVIHKFNGNSFEYLSVLFTQYSKIIILVKEIQRDRELIKRESKLEEGDELNSLLREKELSSGGAIMQYICFILLLLSSHSQEVD